DLLRTNIGKQFVIGLVGHLGIEVREDGGPLVSVGMAGVIDVQAIDGDPLGHVGSVAEIVIPEVAPADQTGADRSPTGRYEHTVPDHDLPLPRAAVVAAQVDE